jgi:hypothetical protein
LDPLDITLYKGKPEIIRQTLAQVKKDFLMFGMELEFSGDTEMAYAEMFRELNWQVQELFETDSHRLSALLYQIDLGENKILEESARHEDWSLSEVITELIIHRELKKVLIRNYYKNNPDKL